MPTIELEEFVVEGGIAQSLTFGEAGYAGQNGSVYDYEDENGNMIEL